MAYNCYLFDETMPVAPSKMTLKIKGKNETVTLLNEGEINFLKYPGLTEITLPLMFPMLTGSKKPDYYLDLLEKAKVNRKTTQLILTRTTPDGKSLFDTNIKVSVEDYEIKEDATDGLDVSVDVTLLQYRDYGTKKVSIKKIKDNQQVADVEKEREDTKAPKATTYTVKKGDTLWAIAKKYLGSGAKYTEIYNANKDIISNPNLITVGMKLTIPQ